MHKLKELRKKHGLLQKDVAQAIGIGRSTYVKYETGDIDPSLDVLVQLANFFNVSIDYILDRQENHTTTKEDIMLSLFGYVSDDVWEELLFAVELIKKMNKKNSQARMPGKGC